LAITEAFAFSAITTSFMTNALSLLDFMSDQVAGVKTVLKRAALALIVISPPVILGIIDPSLFLKALSFAGSFAAILLFGLLPALMAWRGRMRNPNAPYKVKGGYATLIFLIAGSIFVMVVSNFF
jgi:tyrosine-specific transport protein